MAQEEKAGKLVDILSNLDHVEQLKEAGSVEDVQAILSKLGMEVSLEDTQGIVAAIAQADDAPDADGELNEDELQAVAGGSLWGIVKGGAKLLKGAWNWAKEMQDKNSNTYKATKQIVDFWHKVIHG